MDRRGRHALRSGQLLPAQVRSEAIKAIALLRVARSLNQGRRSAVRLLKVASREGHLMITVKAGKAGADLEVWAAEKEVDYFREVFGRELAFRVV